MLVEGKAEVEDYGVDQWDKLNFNILVGIKPTNQIPPHRRQALSFDYRLYISNRGDWLIDSIVIFVYTPYPPAYLSCSLRSFSRSRLSARSRITFSMSYSPEPCFPIVPIPGYKYKDSASNSLLYSCLRLFNDPQIHPWVLHMSNSLNI